MREDFEQFLQFVTSQGHLLNQLPDLFLDLAADQPAGSAPERLAVQKSTASGRVWLRRCNKPVASSACVRTFVGHAGRVNCCAISPDGETIASGGTDGTLRLWDRRRGTERATRSVDSKWVTSCAFVDGGRSIVTSVGDGRQAVFDADTLAHVRDLTCGQVRAVSSDGRWIAAASRDRTLSIIDFETGNVLPFGPHDSWVRGCAISPDRRSIVATAGRTATVWDAATATARLVVRGHERSVNHCAISNDGRWVATADSSGWVLIWHATSGAQAHRLHFDLGVRDLAFATDGRSLVIAAAGALTILEVGSWETRAVLEGHTSAAASCAISPDSRWIVSASFDGTVKLWDAELACSRAKAEGSADWITSARFFPDGRLLATTAMDGTLRIWSADDGSELNQLTGSREPLMGCAITPNGEWIVYAGHTTLSASPPMEVFPFDAYELGTHPERMNQVAMAPHGGWVVTTSVDHSARIWNLRSTSVQPPIVLKGHVDHVYGVAISPDAGWLATGSADGTLRTWDTKDGTPRRVVRGPFPCLGSCAISPDGGWIAAATEGGTLTLWDAASGAVRHFLRTPDDKIEAMSFSPDGTLILAASGNCVLVWDVASGTERTQFLAHTGHVNACCFSPAGTSAVSADSAGTIRLWNPRSGEQLCLYPSAGNITRLAWNAQGTRIAAGGQLGVLHFFEPVNLGLDPPVVTPWVITRGHADGGSGRSGAAIGCPFCRRWSEIALATFSAQRSCPSCGAQVQPSPFTISADWGPIAEAWRPSSQPSGLLDDTAAVEESSYIDGRLEPEATRRGRRALVPAALVIATAAVWIYVAAPQYVPIAVDVVSITAGAAVGGAVGLIAGMLLAKLSDNGGSERWQLIVSRGVMLAYAAAVAALFANAAVALSRWGYETRVRAGVTAGLAAMLLAGLWIIRFCASLSAQEAQERRRSASTAQAGSDPSGSA